MVVPKGSLLLPRSDEQIDSLQDATSFSSLGGNTGDWKIEVCKEDRAKKVFTSYHDLYLFIKLSHAVQNTAATF